jgi:Sodium/calcium exchanger protein
LRRNEINYIDGYEWGSTLTPDSFGQAVLSGVTVGDTVFIVPGSYRGKAFYYMVHPIRLMIYYSTPDVKIKGAKDRATLCVTMCVFWMAAASYVIMLGLIELCNLIQMEPAVMGLTVSAWAASYPALWSSLVVAKDGQGDIVIGNAFGSNVFSNYIGLGLPWLTFSLLNNSTSYDGVQDGGIVLCIVILTGQLVLFYAMVAFNNFEINMWYVSTTLLSLLFSSLSHLFLFYLIAHDISISADFFRLFLQCA